MATKKEAPQAQQDAAENVQQTEAKNTMQPEEKDTVMIHLFKDAHRYAAPVFVGVNGDNYLIQRGVDVEVPKAVAEVLRNSEAMESAAMEKIAAAEAQAEKAGAAIRKI